MPGAIQIFYGDETDRPLITSGMNADAYGSGHSLRSSMNWSSINNSVLTHWQKVGQFRAKHIAVGAGDHTQLSSYNASTGYTFMRSYDDGETTDSIIAVIGAPSNKSQEVDVSANWPNGVTLTNAYDGSTAVVSNGKVTFNTGTNGTILIEGPQPTIHMSVKGKYSFYDSQTVTLSLRGADYATVKVNGGTAFRAVDGQTFTIGEDIEVGTVFGVELSATNSEETITKTAYFKKKDPNAVTKVYFDNSSYKWSKVNIYVYDDSQSEVQSNAAWPGVAMDYDNEKGLYVYEVPDELVNGKAMFNAGNGSANRYPGEGVEGLSINETDMLFSAGTKWTPYNGETAEPETQPDPGETYTVYFDNSSLNYGSPYIYYWVDESDNNGWPGKPMIKVSGNIYKYSVPKKYTNVIFNDKGGSQTADLKVPGDNYVYKDSWSPYSEEQPTTAQPTTAKPTVQPTTAKPTVQPTTVPEVTTVIVGDSNRDGKITVMDATVIQKHVAKVITLTGDALTAADVNRDGKVDIIDATMVQHFLANHVSKCGYAGRDASELQPITKPATQPTTVKPSGDTYTIYFDNSVKKYSAPRIYCWTDGTTNSPAEWPGETMTNVEGNIWKYDVDKKYNMCIFNDGNGSKTDDLNVPGDGYVSNGTNSWSRYGTVEPGESKVIYFDNSSSGFSTPYIYCWIDGTATSPAQWPGEAMTKVSGNIWKYETDSKYNMCIFSNNGESQTGDLSIPATNMVYNGTTWSAYSGGGDTPTPTDTVTVYYDNSNNKYGNPYIYCWKNGTEDSLAAWPGNPMTKVSGNIYKFEVPSAAYNCCIFNDNGGAQTEDLNVPGSGYISNGTSWSIYNPDEQQEDTTPDNPTGVITLKFTNNANWQGDIFCYYWGGSTSGAGYPGNKMNKAGSNVYTIDIPADSQYVIFSADDRSQTGNIPVEGSAHYQTNGQQGNSWYNVTKIG